MKKDEIKKLSTEELVKKEKSQKMMTNLLAGVLLVLFIFTLYSTIREKEFDFMMIVPIALSAALFDSYNTIKAIRDELSNRST